MTAPIDWDQLAVKARERAFKTEHDALLDLLASEERAPGEAYADWRFRRAKYYSRLNGRAPRLRYLSRWCARRADEQRMGELLAFPVALGLHSVAADLHPVTG